MLLLITARGSVAVHSRSGCTHWVDIRCFGGFSFHLMLQNPEPDTYLDRHSVRANEVVDLLFRVGRALMAPRPRGPGSSGLCLHRRGCWLRPGQDRPVRSVAGEQASGWHRASLPPAELALSSSLCHHIIRHHLLLWTAVQGMTRTEPTGTAPPPPTLPCP